MCSIYCNPDLDGQIFYILLASMASVQAEDVRASFLFVGDLNDHHQEWLGSTTTNRHGVAAFDFSTVSGCDQLVVGPTDARGVSRICWRKLRAAHYSADNLLTNTGKVFTFR